MGDHVRIEGVERDRQDSGQSATEFSRPEEEYDTEEHGDEGDREACVEEDGVGIVTGQFRTGAVDEHIAHGPLLVSAFLPFCGGERKLQFEW